MRCVELIRLIKKALVGNSGYILPVALIILLLAALLITPVLSLVATNLNSGRLIERNTGELYAADSGIEKALWHLHNDTDLQLPAEGESPIEIDFPETINECAVEVTISNEGDDTYKINSTATTGDGDSTIVESLILIGSSGGSVWDYAMCSLGGDITLSGNSEVESDQVLGGDCYSNGNIDVSGNAEVDGNATANGEITVSQNADINGEQTEGAEPLTAPEVDTQSYKDEAYSGCTSVSCGSYTHSSLSISTSQTISSRIHVENNMNINGVCTVTFNDTVCVDGDLTIEAITDVTFNGPVKVGGSINITGISDVTFNDTVCTGGNLNLSSSKDTTFGSTIYVGGDLQVTSNIDVFLSGTVYVYGGISVSGNTNFIGGEHIFAETGNITLSGNSQLDAEDIPFFMAISGDVTVSGNNWTSAIIYAPEGHVALTGNCKMFGCLVGESVSGSGNSTVEYPISLRDRDDLPGSGEGAGSASSETSILTYTIIK